MKVTIQKEVLTDIYLEVLPLIEEHWLEVSSYKGLVPLAPDFNKIVHMEKEGICHSYTMRNPSGELVGYASILIDNHLHYRYTKFAMVDAVFVKEEYRGKNSLKFIKHLDEAGKDLGADILMFHVKVCKDYSSVLKHMDYEPLETIYSKHYYKE